MKDIHSPAQPHYKRHVDRRPDRDCFFTIRHLGDFLKEGIRHLTFYLTITLDKSSIHWFVHSLQVKSLTNRRLSSGFLQSTSQLQQGTCSYATLRQDYYIKLSRRHSQRCLYRPSPVTKASALQTSDIIHGQDTLYLATVLLT